MKLWYSLAAKASNAKTLVVTVFEEIGIWGISGKRFADDLRIGVDGKDRIELLINSPGGSVFDALLMFNALRATKLPVDAKVMGLAASAASYLAMAGDTVEMPENTFMMVHNPLAGIYGNAQDMRDFANVLDKVGTSLLATYVKRTGKDEAELKTLFDAESWLTAAECKALGLCDTVTAAMKVAAVYDPDRPGVPENVQKAIKASTDPDPPEPKPVEPTDPVDPADPVDDTPPETTLADRVVAAAERLGLKDYASVFALDDKLTTIEQVETAMGVAREVQALCIVADSKELAPDLIKGRKTLPEARVAIMASLEAKADAAHTSTQKKPKAKGAAAPQAAATFNPVNYWSEQRKLEVANTAARKR